MCFGKQIVSSVKMQNTFGHVLYTNFLSLPPMLLFGLLVTHEHTLIGSMDISASSAALVLLSCLMGIGISYTGWQCRDVLSATSYTLVGVINKLIPVFVNALMWDKHASPGGIFFLLLCLLGGFLYKQAPMKCDVMASEPYIHGSRPAIT
eukprot:NODE_4645_length_781_cov_47.193989_g4301_i0.p1 GENE.NODE_4645_length_781_cov_47.193989_g4301_i0~~NODE_4645_length_781_cov_47.193989_g4301_i0.p1  ORF type:complete len:169 (+),score=31.81 NODE_4645_length_781_cov_47.193989_g4301_i0:58-507(+)